MNNKIQRETSSFLPVLVDGWQLEDRGVSFEKGERVEWRVVPLRNETVSAAKIPVAYRYEGYETDKSKVKTLTGLVTRILAICQVFETGCNFGEPIEEFTIEKNYASGVERLRSNYQFNVYYVELADWKIE